MKKLSFLFVLTFLLPVRLLIAQDENSRLNFLDGEYFLSEEAYPDALLSFKKVYDAGYEDNANLNYRIGVCYLNIEGEKEKAIPYLEKAIQNVTDNYREGSFKEEAAAPDAFLFLGNAYRINDQLDKAISTYNKFLDRFAKGYEKERTYARQQIESCERAKDALKVPAAMKKENLGSKFNSGMDNFHAVQSGNDSVMAFMSQQKFYDAVYFVRKTRLGWTNPVNITPQIQSDGDQYVTSLSYDGKQMFLVKISNFDSDIMISEYDRQTWSKSQNIGKPINSKYFESHASLSPDGKKLFFTSNRNGGFGEMDIYVSEKDASGHWGEPVNLGSTINTPLNEDSPFMSKDGQRLFFSSQGHQSIGGYDIFYSTLNENGTWSEPVREPYPLNTTDDDVFFYPLGDGNAGYLTRYEPDGMGSGDIYEVQLLSPSEVAGINKAKKDEVKDLAQVQEEQKIQTGEGDLPDQINEETTTIEPDTAKNETPAPDIKTAPTYFIKPVFFAFDSYALSENAHEKLADVKAVLQEYPEINLIVRGHTDNIGSTSYNQVLSEKRANAVIDYLVKIGVPRNRMEYKGFSENQPVAINQFPGGKDAKQGRQLNRRVDFRIIGREHGNIVIEPVQVPDDLKINQ